jgi:hypothetical protein
VTAAPMPISRATRSKLWAGRYGPPSNGRGLLLGNALVEEQEGARCLAGAVPGYESRARLFVTVRNTAEPAYFASHADGLHFAPSFSILKCVLVTKSW